MQSRLALLCVVLAGCSSDPEPGNPPPGEPPPIEQPPPSLSGTYDVTTAMDLGVATVLPAPASDYVATLAAFRRDPAQALFDLLDAAGVPLVAELRAALPDVLEDKLNDWIDDAILGR